MIFVLKVATNKEDQVSELIAERARKKQLPVYSVIRPHGLKGYILLEVLDKETAEEATFNISYAKSIIPKTVDYEEIKNLLEYTPATIKMEKGDIVEIIAEPFKKEKAKIIRVDKSKEEVVVELLGAAVPIPVTIKFDNIRVIRREEVQAESAEPNSSRF